MRDRIRKILKESFEEFGNWFDETEPTFKNWDFKFDGKHEYWVDISMLNADEHKLIFDYIKKVVPYSRLSNTATQFARFGFFNGIVIHCANEDNDYFPDENFICFMTEKFDEDTNNENSIYIDGGEVLEYINATSKKNIKEGSGWTDENDSNWDKNSVHWGNDNYFNSKDFGWENNPERSYWKQGSGGGSTTSSAGGEETVKEEEELLDDKNPFNWIENTGEAPNYKGLPQGVVYLKDHDEIDRLANLIYKINPKDFGGRGEWDNIHQGLEMRRDELEEEGYDSNDAVISVSFFVEKSNPDGLSFGYWPHEVDDDDVLSWLTHYDDPFNKEYDIYTSLDKLEKVLKYY
jgi:hypothetical protein